MRMAGFMLRVDLLAPKRAAQATDEHSLSFVWSASELVE